MDSQQNPSVENWTRELLVTPIEELGFSIRTTNCLLSKRIDTVSELVLMTPMELLKIRSFGKTSLREVNRYLHGKGLRYCDSQAERRKVCDIVAQPTATSFYTIPQQPTLRQRYAAHALQGLLANPDRQWESKDFPNTTLASKAFALADAMLRHEANEPKA